MNMLQQKTGLPQFRCLPVVGGRSPSSFRYERMIKGRWIPCNHRRVRGIVGVINRRGQLVEIMQSPTVQDGAGDQMFTSEGLCIFNQSFNAASIRVCQPLPVDLKAFRTSGEYRMVVDSFLGRPKAGLPRRIIFLPSCRLAFSKKALSSSGASSGSTQVLFKSFNFAFISFPHRDNAARLMALRPDHNNKPSIQFTYGNLSGFPVVLSIIFGGEVESCENLRRSGEINATFKQRFFSLVLVIFNFHTISVVTLIDKSTFINCESGRYMILIIFSLEAMGWEASLSARTKSRSLNSWQSVILMPLTLFRIKSSPLSMILIGKYLLISGEYQWSLKGGSVEQFSGTETGHHTCNPLPLGNTHVISQGIAWIALQYQRESPPEISLKSGVCGQKGWIWCSKLIWEEKKQRTADFKALRLSESLGYSSPVAVSPATGICNPRFIGAHNRAKSGFFVCEARQHLFRIMVGRAGQPQGWPGSPMTGIANPARLTTIEICNAGGGVYNLSVK